MNLLQTWLAWFQGQDVAEVALWGHTVNWWGRWGKIAAFPAALLIVLDILQSRSSSAPDNGPSSAPSGRPSYGPGNESSSTPHYALSERFNRNRKLVRTYSATWAALILGALILLATSIPFDVGDDFPEESPTNPLVVLVVLSGALLAVGIFPFFRRVLHRLQKDDRLANIIRVCALALLVIGFQFDLLAS